MFKTLKVHPGDNLYKGRKPRFSAPFLVENTYFRF